ncbi:MAG: YcaO-like family protein [Acidobacteriia bacterium]|nr:YcaO-like family protein [Terriglobia bacterium]
MTDITRLDVAGVPVFVSIRPDAQQGSLCVNAGKGLSTEEARVGAYMESIEYAFAEHHRSSLKVLRRPARDLYDGSTRPEAILDFCPMMNVSIDLDAPMSCVEAHDVDTGDRYLVPAELVFFPFPDDAGREEYFGSNTNGLCSGNSVLEATVHGLAEVIERDVLSFYFVDDQSCLVQTSSLPPAIRRIETNLSAVGLKLYVRYVKNCFELPFFMAFVVEPKCSTPLFINGGFGCNPSREVALTRAVCEALQSRLSFIHGGRDDLRERYHRVEDGSKDSPAKYAQRLTRRVAREHPKLLYEDTADSSASLTDLESSLGVLMASLRRNGFHHVLRVAYTEPGSPLQVVRILVPGLECFKETTTRIGPRLRDYVRDRL